MGWLEAHESKGYTPDNISICLRGNGFTVSGYPNGKRDLGGIGRVVVRYEPHSANTEEDLGIWMNGLSEMLDSVWFHYRRHFGENGEKRQ